MALYKNRKLVYLWKYFPEKMHVNKLTMLHENSFYYKQIVAAYFIFGDTNSPCNKSGYAEHRRQNLATFYGGYNGA